MSDNGTGGSSTGGSVIGKLVFWVIAIVAALVVLRLAFAAVGLAVFVAFRLVPAIIVGWLLYRAWKWFAEKPTGE